MVHRARNLPFPESRITAGLKHDITINNRLNSSRHRILTGVKLDECLVTFFPTANGGEFRSDERFSPLKAQHEPKFASLSLWRRLFALATLDISISCRAPFRAQTLENYGNRYENKYNLLLRLF